MRAASTFGIAAAMVLAWGTVRLNAQELITNGSFSNGLTGWTQSSWAGGSSFGTDANGPTSTAAASGSYAYAGGGTYNLLQQGISAVTNGGTYRLTFLGGSKSGQGAAYGLVSLHDGLAGNYNSASFDYRPTDAVFSSYTVDFTARGATDLWLRSDGGTFIAYDNVSVTQIGSVTNALNYSAAGGFTEITSALSGTGKVSVNAGAGGLTLKGANSHTGGTEVTGGTLYVVGSGTLGAAGGPVTVNATGSEVKVYLDLRNQQTRTGTISTVGENARIIGGDPANPGSIVNNGGALQFGGGQISVPISGTGGLNVTGGGSLNASNSFTGDVTISDTTGWYTANSLFVDNANGLGAASNNLTMSGGIVSLQNNTVTRSGNVTIIGGTVQTGTFSKSGTAYDIQGGNINVVLAGTAGVTKSSTNGAVFNAVNTYTGDTTVSAGTLLVNGTLSDATGALTVSGSGNLDLRSQQTRTGTITMNSQNARILSGDGNGSIVNNGGAFQFGGGWLDAGLSGTGGMNVTGGGRITSSNSYSGNTTVSNTTGWFGTDTLYVDNANGLGAASGNLTVAGGRLDLSNNTITRSGNLTISGNAALVNGTLSKSGSPYDIKGGTIGVVLAGTAGLTKSGTNIATLTASNSYSGDTDIQGGELSLSGSGRLGEGAVTVSSGASLGLSPSGAMVLANNIGGEGALEVNSGDTRLTGDVTSTGGLTIKGGILRIGNAGSTGSYSGDTQIDSGGTLAFDRSDALTYAGVISGSGLISKVSAGVTYLTGNSTNFSGTLTIYANAVRIGNSGTSGAFSGNVHLSSGGAELVFDRSDNYTHTGSISGSGKVVKVAAGTSTVTASNSYTGATQLYTGTLVASNAHAFGSGNITFLTGGGNTGTIRYTAASAGTDWAFRIKNSTGTIRLDTGGQNVTLQGDIDSSNGGGLVKAGLGVLTLSGNNQYSGATTVNQGTLLVSSSVFQTTISPNSTEVQFATPPGVGTNNILPGPLTIASLASTNVTGLSSNTVGTITNNPNLQVIVTASTPANQKPVVDSDLGFSIPENSPLGDSVGTLTATDADGNGLSSWTIVSGNEAGVFALNSETGELTLAGILDYEIASSYTLMVTVSDGTETSDSAMVSVSVVNVPEFADVFGSADPSADSNGDGISNLMAYALGASASNATVSRPVTTVNSSNLTITALVRTNDPAVQVRGSATTNLASWTNPPILGTPAADQAGAVAGVTQKQEFTVQRGTDPKKFLRLRATLQP